MRNAIVVALVILVMVGLLKLLAHWDLEKNALAVGTPVASFSLPDTNGHPYKLPLAGREVLINYWASWCGPCVEEMPILRAFAHRTGANSTQVVGIALDVEGGSRDWVRANPLGYPILVEAPSATDSSVTLGNKRGILPFSVLLDAKGRVLATRTGAFSDAADLDGWIKDAR